MMATFGTDGETAWPTGAAEGFDALAPGAAFTVPENLFAKIEDEQREDWQQRFAGART